MGEDELDEYGAEFSCGGGDAVAGAAVAGWEDFGGDLVRVRFIRGVGRG